MQCITYARVSTDKQAERELSIPAQQQAMREYAERQGWSIAEEFVEPGASGRSAERPVLRRMMSRCREHPKVDVVLVHKIDRLARNVYDHAMIRALLKQKEIRLASVVENVDETVTGQLVENIMASIAEFYSANLGEEVKKGMRVVVQKGGWPHLPPRGYRMERGGDGRPLAVPDEVKAPLVRRAFELYATGVYSFSRLSDELAKSGLTTATGRPIPNSYIQQMLENPFYVGRIRWKGQEFSGKHEPIIDDELFAKASAVMKTRQVDSGEHHAKLRFFLRGVAFCGDCKGRMTAERHGRWSYYRCVRKSRFPNSCAAAFSNVERIHEQVQIVYKQLRPVPKMQQQLLSHTDYRVEERARLAKKRLTSLTMMRAKADQRLARAVEAFASELMDTASFHAISFKVETERKAIEAEFQHFAFDPVREREETKAKIGAAQSLWDIHRALNSNEQKVLLQLVFKQIAVQDGMLSDYVLQPMAKVAFWRDNGLTSPEHVDPQFDLSPIASDIVTLLMARNAAENHEATL